MNKTEIFIEKATKVHGDKYDYSRVLYSRSKDLIKIICSIHGIWEQTPNNHLKGKGCGKCSNNVRLTKKEFIDKSNKIHRSKYDYSKVRYESHSKNVKVICLEHGEFMQNAGHHLKGFGCKKCSNKNKLQHKPKGLSIFIKEASLTHKNKYNYSQSVYKNIGTNLIIICPIHGNFKQRPDHHLNGSECLKCKTSKGENKIREFLTENKIKFEEQKKFKECKNIPSLPFDFYLPELNSCIEFDGKQHYEPIEFFGGIEEFKNLKKRDDIKNKYCTDNNITLLRIRYDEDAIKCCADFVSKRI